MRIKSGLAGFLLTCMISCNLGESSQTDTLSLTMNANSELMTTEIQMDTITVNNISFTMIHVEGDTFTMGATPEMLEPFDNEKPAHLVTLGNYCIGQTEVTQELWQAVMGENPSKTKGDKLPVEEISWDDIQQFLSSLNTLTGMKFRMPTEAEWEFAARGGKLSQHFQYAGSNNAEEVAWYDTKQTNPVGQKEPNELGIYDMSGNVWEWCLDWYDENYYQNVEINPQGPESGIYCVLRGGSWGGSEKYCRCSCRAGYSPDLRDIDCGFRLAY